MMWWFALTAVAGPWDLIAEKKAESVEVMSTLQRVELRDLVLSLVRQAQAGAINETAVHQAHSLGYKLVITNTTATLQPYLPTSGDGLLALRLTTRPLSATLQTPHPWSDLSTGRISDRLFETGEFRAAVWATSHRKLLDEAHTTHTGFQTLCQALSEALPYGEVFQIHGFKAQHGEPALVVGGTSDRLARRLQQKLSTLINDVGTQATNRRLAGQTNAQRKLTLGRGHFTHLELSRPLRVSLRDDDELLSQLALLLVSP